MTAPFQFFKVLKNEESASSFIPYSSHVTKDVIKLDTGDFVKTFRMQGVSYESADTQDLNIWHEQLNGMLRNIASTRVAIWTHVVRRQYNEFPGGKFNPGFCHDFNEKYKSFMANQKMLINELYLTIVYRPQPNKTLSLFERFQKKNKDELELQQRESIEEIEDLSDMVLASMDRYEPDTLKAYEYKGNHFSELLEFLGFLVNGEWRRFPMPRAEIKHILTTSRPFFGKGGTLALKGPSKTQFGGIIVIQEYPSSTCPGIFDDLLHLPFEFVLTQSFTFLSKQVAAGRMMRQQARMVNAGDVATSQIEEISKALDDLISNRFVMGIHHMALLVRAEDPKRLKEHIAEAGVSLSDNGIKWAKEEVGIAGSFWSQLPGNFNMRIRVGDITSRNFAAFSSFHNFPIGRLKNNQWGDSVVMFKTTSGAPYYFNFHKGEEGDAKKSAVLDPNHRDLANTVVIGKSGTGKTVLELVLLAQAQKFHRPEEGKPLTCVLFDKDLGASIGVRAMGGRYYPLKNGIPSGFNPFQMKPNPKNLTFLETLIKQLVKKEGFPITPKQEREISEAISGLMSASKEKRNMSGLIQFLNPREDNGIYVRLQRYCRGNPLGWLFDNRKDTLDVDNTTILAFDVTEFLDNDETRTPTIMYLFHRIESLIDGRRIPIFMDEFWKLLSDDAFQDLAQNKLVTIRKQDGFLVMFTQSPAQVLSSPIAHAIISQTATKIFLPNPEADRHDYVDGFKVTEREYEIIKELGERSRRFLIKQGGKSIVAELNLRGFENELAVLSGNTRTSNIVEDLVQRLGDDPAVWLPEFHKIRNGG